MRLCYLLQTSEFHGNISQDLLNSQIEQVTSDSREVKKNSVFVAISGTVSDGHEFVEQALGAGASLVIGEKPLPNLGKEIPYLKVADSRQALSSLAAQFYGHPSAEMLVIGVTGTSGKTTTTYLIESVLRAAGHQVGVIGTVNIRYGKGGKKVLPATHTTPGPVEVQKTLAQMKLDGCTAVVMEVSSHALKQQRVADVAMDGVVFSNLSPEHMDFHADLEDYYQAKKLLFTSVALNSLKKKQKVVAAVNREDEFGRRLLGELPPGVEPLAFAASEPEGELRIGVDGIRGKIGDVEISSPLLGRFNASNIAAAVAICRGVGIDSKVISEGIRALDKVPGRLERAADEENGAALPVVLVDYAHKPDALEKVLNSLNDLRQGHRLITVVGCGGDRDRSKRPVMGRLAVEHSDHVVITSDNPRTEDPAAIIQEIVAGIGDHTNYAVEPDRKLAIHAAVFMAAPGDIVLIAGKGHETYQIIPDPEAPGQSRKIHFDDREVAREALMQFGQKSAGSPGSDETPAGTDA